MPLTTTLAGGSALIKWLLRDEFTDTRAAGAVNGTPATPGPGGNRAVTDTGGVLSIAGGVATCAAPTGLADPTLATGTGYARVAGRMLFGQMNSAANDYFGLDDDQVGPSNKAGFQKLGTVLYAFDNIAKRIVAVVANSTDYYLCVVLRTTGSYALIKGGTFTDWTLVWIGSVDNTATLYVQLCWRLGAMASEFMRIPDALYLPTPLAYDSFTRANGALGSTEAMGPDGQTAPVKVWQSGGATWAVAGNEAVNTPTEGAELHVQSNAAADPNGTEANATTGWTGSTPANLTVDAVDVDTGAFSLKYVGSVAGGDRIEYGFTSVIGVWYIFSVATKRSVLATDAYRFDGTTIPNQAVPNAWAALVDTGRATATTVKIRGYTGAGFTFWFDNVSVKSLTLNTLFSGVETSTADVVCQVELDTVVAGTQAGLVLNLDDKDTPANFVIAYHDGTNCVLEKCVAGTYTTVITAATAYAAGATLVVIKEGTGYSLYYNNAKVGTTQTVSDAGIIDNTLHGMFNTYSGNQLDNFLVMPRGTGGEYSALNRWSA